jgi:hypothetical protein
MGKQVGTTSMMPIMADQTRAGRIKWRLRHGFWWTRWQAEPRWNLYLLGDRYVFYTAVYKYGQAKRCIGQFKNGGQAELLEAILFGGGMEEEKKEKSK